MNICLDTYAHTIIIYLFIRQTPNPGTAGSARMNAKEREKKERQVRRAKKTKGSKGQRKKLPTPTRAIDALIGDEEQNGKQKKETGNGTTTQLP